MGRSLKGEAAIDWADPQARQALLGEIVADADRLLAGARQAQAGLTADSAARLGIIDAAELLSRLLLQDVQRGQDGAPEAGEVTLKEGVSQDRTVSVHDPEMRHDHKSNHRRFDGHKAAVAVDTDSQLITAVDVLPGNAWDSVGALQLVEQSEVSAGVPVAETMGDAAYGDGSTRQDFADAGRRLVARVPARPQRTHFPKEDFVIDLAQGTCTCPAGQVTRHLVPMATRTDRTGRTSKTKGFRFEGAVCDACSLRPHCVAARPRMGRTVRLHPQEALLQQARALQRSPAFAQYRRLRVVAEHRLARLMQLGMRQARCFGRAQTKCQLYLAATVANLTLVAHHRGDKGDPSPNHPAAPAAATCLATHFGRRQPLQACIWAWLRSPTLPLALCPNRAFRPSF